ncbi:MAG: hypothetical protein AUJ52_15090 [Elusimicrobia bacterium CG1_02_63_36]|nr:MAG: hypothetical protein AUJ52_15090 [Elusimicrobia bacterium CG1_02_63_36]PIP84966.1 MAG: hypothetical protein COR54_01225 [Elusimicrobia bacterium CG22_combo_CG10-13_8_21_14_all_63_91]PJA12384.1 MAG: hypothetical protein COX66_17510 [Elusimicrobia bacterium CG_4_10_14_0_2_um_filter_63_34]PJB26163.1 MAG: hypothetical protein CO113_04930 [Elusimicrobia bacterium CG_4_9_14_3_um_filter_62_55]
MRINNGRILAVLAMVFAAGAMTACHKKGMVKDGEVQDVIAQDSIHRKYFEAIGIAAADPKLPSMTQRRALSRDAAIIKAHNELLTIIKGAQLESGQTVDMSIMGEQKMIETLSQMVKGAEIVKTEFTGDDGAVVTIQLPRRRAEKMLGVKFK